MEDAWEQAQQMLAGIDFASMTRDERALLEQKLRALGFKDLEWSDEIGGWKVPDGASV